MRKKFSEKPLKTLKQAKVLMCRLDRPEFPGLQEMLGRSGLESERLSPNTVRFRFTEKSSEQ